MKHNLHEGASNQNEAAKEQNKKTSKTQHEGQHDATKHIQGGRGSQGQSNMHNDEAAKKQPEKQGNKK